jgi:hypothetical protein
MRFSEELRGTRQDLFEVARRFLLKGLIAKKPGSLRADRRSGALVKAKLTRVQEFQTARETALAAGYTRVRPVLMTALAMILGMIPTSLDTSNQNAPLGRAVIGGLLIATATTLFFVPVMYKLRDL